MQASTRPPLARFEWDEGARSKAETVAVLALRYEHENRRRYFIAAAAAKKAPAAGVCCDGCL